MSTLQFEVFPHSITNKRAENQDVLWYGIYETPVTLSQGILAIVSDGMGGLDKGAAASQTMGNLCEDFFQNSTTLDDDILVELIEYAHERVRDLGRAGATVSLLRACKSKYFIAHLGDSRVYRIPAQGGRAIQLTADHSAIAEALQQGIRLTPELIQRYQGKVTRGLGMPEKPDVATYQGTYNPGDSFLLCSDGFWHNFDYNGNVLPELSQTGIEEATARAVDAGETDNISVLLIKA